MVDRLSKLAESLRSRTRTFYSPVKQICLMHQDEVKSLEVKAVLEGVSELVRLAKVNGVDFTRLPINSKGIEEYIKHAKSTSRNDSQLNADTIGLDMIEDPSRNPTKGGKDHYKILIVNGDIYSGNANFLIGSAREGIGATVSTYRLQGLSERAKYECLKTIAIHEFGHVFGLIPESRTDDVEEIFGKHCTNVCVMRQGLDVPHDWIKITSDRLVNGTLCNTCETDLQNYFRQ
ncbi:MAG TPA: hypothetical protein VJI68_00650 [Candidatus Nanoarchaeia archaeon]|nr:hypothetical protein [Candidatus Nanoarchaeia archaeon]